MGPSLLTQIRQGRQISLCLIFLVYVFIHTGRSKSLKGVNFGNLHILNVSYTCLMNYARRGLGISYCRLQAFLRTHNQGCDCVAHRQSHTVLMSQRKLDVFPVTISHRAMGY